MQLPLYPQIRFYFRSMGTRNLKDTCTAWPCSQAVPTSSIWSLAVDKYGGKAWEIWSHAMPSGRQKVDTWGAVLSYNNSCFVLNHPWCHEQQTVIDAVLLMLCLLQPSDWQYKKGLQDSLLGITPRLSTICLPDVITVSPRPSPSVLAYCKWSNTEGGNSLGTAWEQGTRYSIHFTHQY